LDVLRRVIAGAPAWLASDGVLIVESSRTQAPAVAAAMRHVGLTGRVVRDDDLDATAVAGRT